MTDRWHNNDTIVSIAKVKQGLFFLLLLWHSDRHMTLFSIVLVIKVVNAVHFAEFRAANEHGRWGLSPPTLTDYWLHTWTQLPSRHTLTHICEVFVLHIFVLVVSLSALWNFWILPSLPYLLLYSNFWITSLSLCLNNKDDFISALASSTESWHLQA